MCNDACGALAWSRRAGPGCSLEFYIISQFRPSANVAMCCCLCRLNYRLSTACHETIGHMCNDACGATSLESPCGGRVLRCLTDKLEEITDEECKKEVFYFEKMEVQDFRNDIMLAEACRMDVDTICSTIQPGEDLMDLSLLAFRYEILCPQCVSHVFACIRAQEEH